MTQAVFRCLSGFDFDIDGLGSMADREVEYGQLLFNAAVEFPVILVTPAGGDYGQVGELFEEGTDGFGAFARMVQEIQAEFEECLTALSFAPGVVE
jgi:hypothetical protein